MTPARPEDAMSETGAERQLGTLEQAKQSGHDTCDAVVCKTCNSVFYEGTWHPLAVESQGTPGATPLRQQAHKTSESSSRMDVTTSPREGVEQAGSNLSTHAELREEREKGPQRILDESADAQQGRGAKIPLRGPVDAPKPAGGTLGQVHQSLSQELQASQYDDERILHEGAGSSPEALQGRTLMPATSSKGGTLTAEELRNVVCRIRIPSISVDEGVEHLKHFMRLSARNTAALTRERGDWKWVADQRHKLQKKAEAEIERLKGELAATKLVLRSAQIGCETAETELARLRGQGAPQSDLCRKSIWLAGLSTPAPCQRPLGHDGACDPFTFQNSAVPQPPANKEKM